MKNIEVASAFFIIGLVIGAGAFYSAFPRTIETTITQTTPTITTSQCQNCWDIGNQIIQTAVLGSDPSKAAIQNCSTLAAYFAEFKNPIIVANYNYYIYRQPTPTLGTLPDFSDIAGRILSNTVVRTSSYPVYNQTTYFWEIQGNWYWKACA